MKNSIFIVTLFVLFYGNLFGQTFTKITQGDIVNDPGVSLGSSWGDYDKDGYIDLFVTSMRGLLGVKTNYLYNNNGDGTFTKITQGDIVTDTLGGVGSSWGDYDNNGFLDLFVTTEPNLLYRNDGNGTFTKITSGDIVSDSAAFGSWGDYDNDGYLDLFAATLIGDNLLYHNNGDGTFTKITVGVIVNDGGTSLGANWGDYDNDGYLDLFVANGDDEDNFLYHNNGDGTSSKITQGAIVNDGGNSEGSSWGDYDNDGYLDLFVANGFVGPQNNFLYRNNGDGTFTKITTGDIVNDGGNSFGSSWGDYDNDGFLDMFVANGDSTFPDNFLYNNNGDGTFTKITAGIIVNDGGWSQGCNWGDYDNDGFLDMYVSNRQLYLNNGNSNNWINIMLFGTQSNTSAIGTKVRVKSIINGNPTWQMREVFGQTSWGGQNSLNAEFGLGDATVIDSVIIEWPSDTVDIYTDIAVNTFYIATEGQDIVTSIKDKDYTIPEKFELGQNYPNPFNPTTIVRYSVPELSFVTIKVYDVLGGEIVTLVNEEKVVGSYEVDFNAAQLPSGIYFYRLQAGSFVETKKMVLMK
jgi:hypothetical protein